MTESVSLSIDARRALVRRGLLLNGVTLGYNTLEAAVSLLTGFAAGSVALIARRNGSMAAAGDPDRSDGVAPAADVWQPAGFDAFGRHARPTRRQHLTR